MKMDAFSSARLVVRPMMAADAGFALCLWGDPISGQYLSDPPLDKIRDLNNYLAMIQQLGDSPDAYYWIAENKTTGQPVGTACAVPLEKGRVWDIGYCIHPSVWRQGYGVELVDSLVQRARSQGVQRIQADVAADNTGSCKILQRLGFTSRENGTFHRGETSKEYQNLTFQKEW